MTHDIRNTFDTRSYMFNVIEVIAYSESMRFQTVFTVHQGKRVHSFMTDVQSTVCIFVFFSSVHTLLIFLVEIIKHLIIKILQHNSQRNHKRVEKPECSERCSKAARL